jgi:hypothetical protein
MGPDQVHLHVGLESLRLGRLQIVRCHNCKNTGSSMEWPSQQLYMCGIYAGSNTAAFLDTVEKGIQHL